MQFLILLIGVLVFAFYQFNQPPVFFNKYEVAQVKQGRFANEYNTLENQYTTAFTQRKAKAQNLINAFDSSDKQRIATAQSELKAADAKTQAIRHEAIEVMKKTSPKADGNDTNYVFLTFVTQNLPTGLIGLLIAIVFLASMGSTASALNSLASTSVIDVYKRVINPNATDKGYLNASRWATVIWGVAAIGMALYASKLGNLLEAVNQLGSYIYGTMLGIFVVAFYLKKIKGNAVFAAAIITEVIVCLLGYHQTVAYLWLNAIGCVGVVVIALVIKIIFRAKLPAANPQAL